MPIRQTIFSVFVALCLVVIIVELVRKRKLREEYSWLWLLTGATILGVVIWYDALVWLTELIGAVLPTTTLFLMAILYLMAIALHFSVRVSKLDNQVKELAQAQALFEEKVVSDGIRRPRPHAGVANDSNNEDGGARGADTA